MLRPGSAEERHYWRPSRSFLTNVDPLLRPRARWSIMRCLFAGWFVCLFFGIKPEKLYPTSCWEGSKPPGSGHTRAEAHNRDIRSGSKRRAIPGLRARSPSDQWTISRSFEWTASCSAWLSHAAATVFYELTMQGSNLQNKPENMACIWFLLCRAAAQIATQLQQRYKSAQEWTIAPWSATNGRVSTF